MAFANVYIYAKAKSSENIEEALRSLILAYQSFEKAGVHSEIGKVLAEASARDVPKKVSFQVQYA